MTKLSEKMERKRIKARGRKRGGEHTHRKKDN